MSNISFHLIGDLTEVIYSGDNIDSTFQIVTLEDPPDRLLYETKKLIGESYSTIFDDYLYDSTCTEINDLVMNESSSLLFSIVEDSDSSEVLDISNCVVRFISPEEGSHSLYILFLPLIGEDYSVSLITEESEDFVVTLSDLGIDYTISDDRFGVLILRYNGIEHYEVHNINPNAHSFLYERFLTKLQLREYIDSSLWTLVLPSTSTCLKYEGSPVYYDDDFINFEGYVSGATGLIFDKRSNAILGGGLSGSLLYNVLGSGLKILREAFVSQIDVDINKEDICGVFTPFRTYNLGESAYIRDSSGTIQVYIALRETSDLSPRNSNNWRRLS